MKTLSDYSVILWDFDGVIMNSMNIRDHGFSEVLKHFPADQVAELLAYHKKNGGLSRYVKFAYFFEEIRKEPVSKVQVQEYAQKFSQVMLSLLIRPELLIADSLSFIKQNPYKQTMHIVSGSDGNELRQICQELDISSHFLSIHGSPTPKKQLVSDIIAKHNYPKEQVVLIGDSGNDFDASQINGIDFVGYNNPSLQDKGVFYLHEFPTS